MAKNYGLSVEFSDVAVKAFFLLIGAYFFWIAVYRFNDSIGGYEERCAEVATYLGKCGHSIAVLTSNYSIGKSRKHEENVYRVLNLESDLRYYQPKKFFTHRKHQERENLANLKRVISEFHPDVIFVWGMWNLSKSLPGYIEVDGKPQVVYSISDYWPSNLDMHRKYWLTVTKNHLLL